MSSAEPKQTGAMLHGIAFFAPLLIVGIGFPSLGWPWYMLIPVAAYGVCVAAIPKLRQSAPIPRIGNAGGRPLAFAAVVTIGASSFLVGFHWLFQPDVSEFGSQLPIDWIGNLWLAVAILSLVNAALEELIFRFIVWEIVADEWNTGTAFVLTSVLFGLAHWNGYPPGVVGTLMAGLYGVTLGVLRWWAGGLALAYVCHIFADVTILSIVAMSGALDCRQ